MHCYLCTFDVGYGIDHKLVVSSKTKAELEKHLKNKYTCCQLNIRTVDMNQEQELDIVFQET